MSGWPNQGWRENFRGFGRALAEQAGDTVDRWRDRGSLLAARWRRMQRGEQWNVALYLLTSLSMLALTVELLAGPDTLPTEVTSAPAPIGSSGLTPVIPSSTTTLTLPPVTEPPVAGPVQVEGPATTAAARPAPNQAPQANRNPNPQPAAPPPTDPPPTDPPPTDPPPTAPPTSKPPATTISTGFTVVPPIPPSFP